MASSCAHHPRADGTIKELAQGPSGLVELADHTVTTASWPPAGASSSTSARTAPTTGAPPSPAPGST
ncbi:hypothetical protein [Nonomuraea dietziae]|uniref:hypothetical protein n=1 Tax=Nonomuraea dietziae TaxID=65515 RepID=UPI0031D39840